MQRPTAVTVFGILNIVFGVMAVTLTPIVLITIKLWPYLFESLREGSHMENPLQATMQSPSFMAYASVSVAVSVAVGALQIAAGIGLLNLRPWARHVSIGYAVYCWVAAAAGAVINYFLIYVPMLETPSSSGESASIAFALSIVCSVVGTFTSLIYPTLLFIFMLRPEIKAAFQPGWGTPPPLAPGSES